MVAETQAFSHALVVDDDEGVTRAVRRALLYLDVAQVDTATGISEAISKLRNGIDLLIVDVCYPEGDCLSIVEAAEAFEPPPRIIAMSGQAQRTLTVELLTNCVDFYLEKPVDLPALKKCVEALKRGDTLLNRQLKHRVGLTSMKEMKNTLRKVMCEEAIERSGGNIHEAARILRVDRRVIQRMSK